MNRRLAFVLLLVAMAPLGDACRAASPKRGWAGGEAAEINASNASWYYRWWHDIPTSAQGAIADFIPLIKFYSTPENLQSKLDIINGYPEVDTVLVLNEPERPEQSDVTVAEAIGFWPQVQSNLPTHKLVSPGVSDNVEGQAWLASFMNEVDTRNSNGDPADDLRVDAVAFHWYGASSPNNPASAAQSFLNRVEWYHTTYNLPVWITEFAMHDWEGDDTDEAMMQANAEFLEIVIPELEARSYVEAYSFYQHFSDAQIYEGDPLAPSVIGDQYIGTLQSGQTQDLAGVGLGTDVVYLRGASIVNSGDAIIDAVRGVDALEGVNTFGGASDWSIPPRRDAYLRARAGATLQKTGPSTIEINSAIEIDGLLHVREGAVRFVEGPFSGVGTTRIGDGGTLGVTFQDGRGVYTISSHTLELAGRVEGALRLQNGSTLVALGDTATFDSDLIVDNSVIEIEAVASGGDPLVAPVAEGLTLNYDAAQDTPSDATWSDANGSVNNLQFTQSASPVAVNDSTFVNLSQAYAIGSVGGASGLNQYFEEGGPRSRQDATFEVVFHVDDTAAGTDQVIWESGGANRGVAMVLNGDMLTFNVDGDAADIELTHQVGAGWRQAIGVIDLTSEDDTVSLYVDGQLAGTLSGQTIVDWSGGNISGLGTGADSTTGVASSPGVDFHGEIAIARYYQATAFDAQDALQNYEALTSGFQFVPSSMLVEGDLTLEGATVLRIDLGEGGASDHVDVLGTLNLLDAQAEISYLGAVPLAAGDAFDLIDAATTLGEFSSATLPTLQEGLMWNLDGISLDGSILVTISGDYNGDGVVDAADYTVWRDHRNLSLPANSGADGNGDGLIDLADLDIWRSNFGAQWSVGAAAQIPEPNVLALVLCAVSTAPSRRTCRRTPR